jgi:hypothetical protein
MAALALIASIHLSTARGAQASERLHKVWCGHWDANPGRLHKDAVGAMARMRDGSVATLVRSTVDNQSYVWAELHAPKGNLDHIALIWWALDQTTGKYLGTYQCGNSYGSPTATVWSYTAYTWTSGVPLKLANKDAVAVCAGYMVWNNSGKIIGGTPHCTNPWTLPATQVYVAPAPPSPSPPFNGVSAPDRAELQLSASPRTLHNFDTVRLTGRIVSRGLPPGVVVDLSATSVRGPRRWLKFDTTIACRTWPPPNHPGGCAEKGQPNILHFSSAWKFTNTLHTTSYLFRAQLPFQFGYPLSTDTSRLIVVKVIN